MAFVKQSMRWGKFFGGLSNDDKLTQPSQVLYAENLDLKRNSDFVQLNPISTRSVITGGNKMFGFINITNTLGAKKTFGYGESGDIYDVGATDNTPTNTTLTTDLVNAIEFNLDTYFVPSTGTASIVSLQKTNSHNAYSGTFSFTAVATSLNGATEQKYPLYNYLEAYLYVGIGKSVFRIDTSGVTETFNLGTANIIAITQLGGVFKLYQVDGRVMFWDGLSGSIDSVVNIDDEIRSVLSHRGIDYIVGGPSGFYSNFYFMNGYRAEIIQTGIDSEIPQSPQNSRSNKFFLKGGVRQILSYDGQIIFINEDSLDSIHSFGSKRIGFPKGFENKFILSPDNNTFQDIFSVGISTSHNGFYYHYNDGTNYAIGHFQADSTTTLTSGSLILPVFDGGSTNIKKKIEEIKISGENLSSNSKLTLKTSVDGGSFTNSTDITTSGRTIINSVVDDFFELVIQIDFTIVSGTTNPRLKEIELIYTIIED